MIEELDGIESNFYELCFCNLLPHMHFFCPGDSLLVQLSALVLWSLDYSSPSEDSLSKYYLDQKSYPWSSLSQYYNRAIMADKKVDSKKKAYLDLHTFFEFQREMHTPKPVIDLYTGQPKVDPSTGNVVMEEVPIRFMSAIETSPWSATFKEQLHRTEGGDADQAASVKGGHSEVVINYTANSKYDILSHSYLVTRVPLIRVDSSFRETVRICWTENLFHHIILAADIIIGGDEAVGFGVDASAWLDVWMQHMMKSKPGMYELYSRLIGNWPFLTNWSHQLPSFPIACPLPTYYDEHDTKAVHLHLMRPEDAFVHRHRFRLNISQLLRMQIKNEAGEWETIPFDAGLLSKSSAESRIPVPHMTGKYSVLTKDEKKVHRRFVHSTLATNILNFLPPNDQGSGKVTVDIETSTPVSAFFITAQNIIARNNNDRSNYTTDSENRYSQNAWPPIKGVKMRYGNTPVQTYGLIELEGIEAWYHSNSAPRSQGYPAISKNYNPGSLDPDTGIVCAKDNHVDLLLDVDSKNPVEQGDDLRDGLNLQERLDAARALRRNDHGPTDDQYYAINVMAMSFKKLRFSNGRPVVIEDGIKGRAIPPDEHFP